MIAVDTNILVYAHREDAEWHSVAYEKIRSLAEGGGAWAIPWRRPGLPQPDTGGVRIRC